MKKPEAQPERPMTPLQRFQVEEEKIRADTQKAQAYYDETIKKQEKILAEARAARERLAASLAQDISDFLKIENELEGEERQRLDAQGKTKRALDEGKISGAEFYRAGLSEAEITAKAQTVAGEKLAAMRDAIRAKGIKLLEAEVVESNAAFEIDFGRVYPAMAMLERLKGLVKSLESNLVSPLGLGGMVGSQSTRDAKKRALDNATGKRLDSDGWKDYDLAGLKRLRLDPCWPADQLPELEKIITEAKTSGRGCRVMLNPQDKRNPVGVMWS